MLEKIKSLFTVSENTSVRLVVFNIITFTVFALGSGCIIVMKIGNYGEAQIPSLILTYVTILVSIVIANVFHKLNLAAGIIVSVITFVLYPVMYFSGGAVYGGMPTYFTLGMVFLFLLCEGPMFVVLLIIQIIVYVACFVISYFYPEVVIPLGNTASIYTDIFQSTIICGLVLGLINKLEIKSYEDLIKKAKLQNEELKKSEARAERANLAKSEFLSNMSHEIRTPINAIIGMNEVIRRDAKDPEIQEYSNVIKISANALLTIINDVLDFSKIESGKMSIHCEKYDLFSLINDSYNMVIDRANDKGLEISIKCDENLPAYLNGDIVRVRQVIINILTNAVKYTDKGSILLSVSGQVHSQDTVDLTISVKDTGIGMKPEDMERLFDKFERFDLVHNQTIEGTGLGLTIVKNLVSLMNGTVSVESEYGKGSEFTVIIPQNIEGREKIGQTKFGVISSHKDRKKYVPSIVKEGSRVLCVDDVQMNLMVFKKLIKDTKIEVDTATSAEICLELIKEVKYDLIFMDHMMPGMNGIEAFERIRADKTHKNVGVPVVMLTANAIAGMEEEYLGMGFSDYISKPIDSTRLESILKKYLDNNKEDETENTADGAKGVEIVNTADNTKDETAVNMADDANKSEAVEETVESEGIAATESAAASEEIATTESTAASGETKAFGKTDTTNKEDIKVDCNVNIEAGIENCGGMKDFYIEILDSFVEEGKREELIQNYADKDWELYTINVHSLKGTLRLIGANDAGDVAEKLQMAGEQKDVATIDSLHETLIQMIDVSLSKIRAQV